MKRWLMIGAIVLGVLALSPHPDVDDGQSQGFETFSRPYVPDVSATDGVDSRGPVRTIDLSELRRHQTEESAKPGPRSKRPTVRPVASGRRGLRQIVLWRNRELFVPVDRVVHGIFGDGVVVENYSSVLQVRGFDGSVRELGRYGRHLVDLPVFGLAGRVMAFVVRGEPGGDDRIFFAQPASDTAARLRLQDHGPRPEGTVGLRLGVAAILGPRDIAYSSAWEDDNDEMHSLGFARTSGKTADWRARDIVAFSARAQLVVGWSTVSKQNNCIAVYRADGFAPEWTTCLTVGDKAAPIRGVDLSPKASHLAVQVQGRHRRDDTLLVLDAGTGRIEHQWERDLGYGVVFEDNHHLLFVSHTIPADGPRGSYPYQEWVVRCSIAGHCENATTRHTTTNFEQIEGVLPRSD